MIMLPNGEKEASTMCVVLIGRQHEVPWHRRHVCRSPQPQERRTSGGTMALVISRRPGAVAKSVVRAVMSSTDLCLVTRNDTMLLLSSK